MYEFDACPFCKKVREMCSYLDVDCVYKPCPQGSATFREEAKAKSGKSMFPYMEDPNTGKAMNESDDIIKYLADTYGDGTVPLMLRLGIVTALTAGFSALPRCARRRRGRRPARAASACGGATYGAFACAGSARAAASARRRCRRSRSWSGATSPRRLCAL